MCLVAVALEELALAIENEARKSERHSLAFFSTTGNEGR